MVARQSCRSALRVRWAELSCPRRGQRFLGVLLDQIRRRPASPCLALRCNTTAKSTRDPPLFLAAVQQPESRTGPRLRAKVLLKEKDPSSVRCDQHIIERLGPAPGSDPALLGSLPSVPPAS